jgi:hypothetical protein
MKPTMPENLSELPAEEFKTLCTDIRAYAKSITESVPQANISDIEDAAAMYKTILAERATRADADSKRAALASSIEEDADEDDEDIEDAADEEVEQPVPAIVASTKRKTQRASTLDEAAPTNATNGVITMLSAPDVPGMAGGQVLTNFSQAAKAIDARLRAYTPSGAPSRRPTPIRGDHTFAIEPGRTAVRHGAVVFKRDFPEELRIREGDSGRAFSVARFAAKESRLPGGSLLKSAQLQMKQGRSLTAAAGWCSPSETIYSLCELSSLDGILDMPEIQSPRGGYQVPADGGPNFSEIWAGIGNAGDVILSEYDVINGAEKECFEIPCPDFEDVRLDVAYLCLTGSLLQSRGYPEIVEWFAQEAMNALAHKINAAVIASIVAASGPQAVIPLDASGDDAASSVLSAVDLAIEDSKYRNRMSRGSTLEVVMPYWGLTQIRAALSRRTGVALLDVTDELIFEWFAARHAMLRLVYDWQDAYTGLVGGPGGANPLLSLPVTMQFMIYPAGTWTKIVQDVVNLDTVYDNAMLTSNQYTAIFAEDGFNVIQTCPESRLYTVATDPSGVVGCCP